MNCPGSLISFGQKEGGAEMAEMTERGGKGIWLKMSGFDEDVPLKVDFQVIKIS